MDTRNRPRSEPAVSHVNLREVMALVLATGTNCILVDGAQGRSARMFAPAGYNLGVQATAWHHTASAGSNPEADVRFIIGGNGEGWVISNTYVSRGGVVYLIASGPTYTEGKGGPRGLIAENGANRVCFSTEIANLGDGEQSYPDAQVEAVWNLASVVQPYLAGKYGWPDDPFSPERMFSHFEWTSRKIDPLGPCRWGPGKWDMNKFRADVRQRSGQGAKPGGKKVHEFKQRVKRNGEERIKLKAVTEFNRPVGLPAEAELLHCCITVVNPSASAWLTSKARGGDWDDTSAGNFNGGPGTTSLYPLISVDGNGYAIGVGGGAEIEAYVDIMGWS